MRKPLLFLTTLVAVAAAAQAQAPTELSIANGEAIVLRIAADGGVTVAGRGEPAPMTAFDTRALRDMVGTPVPAGAKTMPAIPLKDPEAQATPVASGEVRLTFRDVPGKTPHDALLVLENGYDRAFVYRAVMRRGDKSVPTDVCLVMPMKRGYEHWPFQIDRLDLSAVRLVPWKESDGIPCQ